MIFIEKGFILNILPLRVCFSTVFRIRIRIGSSFDGFLDPDPFANADLDPEGGKSAKKRRKSTSEDQKKL
jgi:hypothetical protein